MLEDKLKQVPRSSGVYLMKDINGVVIYVGKAKILRTRVSSYFNKEHTGKTGMLVRNIADFDYVLTNTEVEALVLEANLIKKYTPKYNVLMKDDKSYPYIGLTNELYPKLKIVRRLNKKSKNMRYFGPYPSAGTARSIVNLLNRLYPLRKCNELGKKICLYHHIEECLGYCEKLHTDKNLEAAKKSIISFLNGNSNEVIKRLKAEMEKASGLLQFERAQELKLILEDIKYIMDKQRVELKQTIDADVFGIYERDGYLSINVFFMRGGKLLNSIPYLFGIVNNLNDELETFIARFYSEMGYIVPNEVILSVELPVLNEYLNNKCLVPSRGDKKKLLKLANANAKDYLKNNIEQRIIADNKTMDTWLNLGEILGIKEISRIEVFDNAHLFGTSAVSGMVVYKDGLRVPNSYRKFKINHDNRFDDLASMKEVIYRRYFKLMLEKELLPSAIIVDGGITQVRAASEVIEELGLSIPVFGLTKDKKHKTNTLIDNLGTPITINEQEVFNLLSRMQEEVHRFTINYHKTKRSKGVFSSSLDDIPGLGPKRKSLLLSKYSNMNELKNATLEELQEILPKGVATKLVMYFKGQK